MRHANKQVVWWLWQGCFRATMHVESTLRAARPSISRPPTIATFACGKCPCGVGGAVTRTSGTTASMPCGLLIPRPHRKGTVAGTIRLKARLPRPGSCVGDCGRIGCLPDNNRRPRWRRIRRTRPRLPRLLRARDHGLSTAHTPLLAPGSPQATSRWHPPKHTRSQKRTHPRHVVLPDTIACDPG